MKKFKTTLAFSIVVLVGAFLFSKANQVQTKFENYQIEKGEIKSVTKSRQAGAQHVFYTIELRKSTKRFVLNKATGDFEKILEIVQNADSTIFQIGYSPDLKISNNLYTILSMISGRRVLLDLDSYVADRRKIKTVLSILGSAIMLVGVVAGLVYLYRT